MFLISPLECLNSANHKQWDVSRHLFAAVHNSLATETRRFKLFVVPFKYHVNKRKKQTFVQVNIKTKTLYKFKIRSSKRNQVQTHFRFD